jgi:NarL family two-component system sensor histidine kinase YdfH
LAEARSAIEELRDETMRADQFSKAVQDEICRFIETTGISCVTDLGALATIPPWLREHALRLLAEGLSNVMRHAQAHRVWVSVIRSERMIALEVRDDGVGFDPAAVLERTGHYGLIGLRERACLFGGTLEVKSTPGTTIQLSMPTIDRGGGD